MKRQIAALGRSQKLADPLHHSAGIVTATAQPPLLHLLGQERSRLPGERRIGRAEALPLQSMASRAGLDAPLGIAACPQRRHGHAGPSLARERHCRVMEGYGSPGARVEAAGDPAHLDVSPPPVGVSDQLALEIAGVEPCQTGRVRTVAAAVKPVAGDAGIGSARRSAAERDQLPRRLKAIRRCRLRRSAGANQERRGGEKEAAGHGAATRLNARWFLPFLLLTACKPPPEQHMQMPQADAAHGKQVIQRVGCGSCHRIPGIDWPQGKVGPVLDGLAERALLAGRLPNRPDVLSAYVQNAPALVPNSGMPAMPVSDEEARDIAAYLYDQGSQ